MTGGDDGFDVVTGAFSYSGAAIASQLQATGRRVRTLTGHPGRAPAGADTEGPATGETVLSQWITDRRDTLGRVYANELTRHLR